MRKIEIEKPPGFRWAYGTRVRKKSGSSWQGFVRGFYSNEQTAEGYCVTSEREAGSTQIYPASALELVDSEDAYDPSVREAALRWQSKMLSRCSDDDDA